jgi:hypothetical protein
MPVEFELKQAAYLIFCAVTVLRSCREDKGPTRQRPAPKTNWQAGIGKP